MSEFDGRKRNQDKNKIKKKMNKRIEDENQHKIFRGNMLIQQVTLGQY